MSGTHTDFARGNLMSTGRSTDVAVEGEGFLPVTDGNQVYYTRNGSLGLDANGYLVQLASGLRVLATPPAASGGPPAPPEPQRLPAAPQARRPSRRRIRFRFRLVRQQPPCDFASGPGRKSGLTDSGRRAVPGHVPGIRLLGAGHDMTLNFTRSATAGQWDVTATSPDGAATLAAPTSITFDANGAASPASLSLQFALKGGSGAGTPQPITVSLANVTQLAQDNSAALRSRDGMPPGTLTGISISEDGTVLGVFSNGMAKPLGQVVTGAFTNPSGLESVRDSLYQASLSSGTAAYGVPGSAGHGQSGRANWSDRTLT